jgi:hypothetical protein
MLNDGRLKLSALANDRLELLRDCPLDEDTLLLNLGVGKRDVDGGRLGGDDLGLSVKAVFREVDISRVGRVDGDGRGVAENLDREGRRRGDREGGHDGFEQDGRLLRRN